MRFEDRTGPQLGADAPRYPAWQAPSWWRDAKLGFFVHWGLYSVAGYAEPRVPGAAPFPVEDAYAHHAYAEWYANTVRLPESTARVQHNARFGPGTSYEDLAERWQPAEGAVEALVDELAAAGGRYLIPTAKHHDGFCLWDTATTPFNTAARGPRRDLIRAFHTAARAHGLRFGVYFSGAHDWHVADLPPIRSDVELFRSRRNDAVFAAYAAAQLDELIERFAPDVLWNDIDWPDGGKGREPYGVAALLTRYLAAVPDGAVDDRWGVPFHGFLTREYTAVETTLAEPWEATRGLGRSFGYNSAESAADVLSGDELIRLLVDVVSKNGNLLLNVGPRADGTIDGLQLTAVRELGAWMAANGSALYDSRPWEHGDGEVRRAAAIGAPPLAFTAHRESVSLFALDPAVGHVLVPAPLRGRRATWRMPDGALATAVGSAGDRLEVPAALRGAPVAVAELG